MNVNSNKTRIAFQPSSGFNSTTQTCTGGYKTPTSSERCRTIKWNLGMYGFVCMHVCCECVCVGVCVCGCVCVFTCSYKLRGYDMQVK